MRGEVFVQVKGSKADWIACARCWISAAVAIAVIVSLMASGFDPRFAHMCGYTIGVAVFFLAAWARGYTQSSTSAGVIFAIVATSYAFSLVAFTALNSHLTQNAYVAQGVAAIVFFIAVYFLRNVASKATNPSASRAAVLDFLQKGARPMLAALIIALAVAAIYSLIVFAGSIGDRANYGVSNRVQSWLNTAECYAKTGQFLAACTDTGGVMPIEDAGLSDDRGQALMLSIAGRWFGAPIDKRTLTVINFAVSVFGTSLLAWQIARNGWGVAGVILFLSGIIISNAYLPGPDAPSTYLGLFALTLVMPIQLLRMFALDRIGCRDWIWFVASIVILSFVAVMRQPFGIMAIAVAACSLVLRLGAFRGPRSIGRAIIVVAALGSFYLATHATQFLISARSALQGIPQGTGTITHGIAHNLYIGLGAEPNSFGIKYDDEDGIAAVKKIDPNILYGSNAYYNALWKLYFEIVREHPTEVARIYAAKVSKAFGTLVLPLSLLLVAAIVLAVSFQRRQGGEGSGDSVPYVVGLTCGLIALNSLQGVLTFPFGNNFPALIGFAALWAIAVDIWYKLIVKDIVLR